MFALPPRDLYNFMLHILQIGHCISATLLNYHLKQYFSQPSHIYKVLPMPPASLSYFFSIVLITKWQFCFTLSCLPLNMIQRLTSSKGCFVLTICKARISGGGAEESCCIGRGWRRPKQASRGTCSHLVLRAFPVSLIIL